MGRLRLRDPFFANDKDCIEEGRKGEGVIARRIMAGSRISPVRSKDDKFPRQISLRAIKFY